MSETETTLNLRSEVLALLDSLKCRHAIQDGIVCVTTPSGTNWDFTVPQEVHQKLIPRQPGLTLHDYEMALESQSACNLSGIVKSLALVMDRIWEEARAAGQGTEWVNTHCICRLYAEQIYHLSSGNKDTSYGDAYNAVEAKINELKKSKTTQSSGNSPA